MCYLAFVSFAHMPPACKDKRAETPLCEDLFVSRHVFNKNHHNNHVKVMESPSFSVKKRRKSLYSNDFILQDHDLAFRLDFFEIKASACETLSLKFHRVKKRRKSLYSKGFYLQTTKSRQKDSGTLLFEFQRLQSASEGGE